MNRILRWSPFAVALLGTLPASPANAQGVINNLYTRRATTGQSTYIREAENALATASPAESAALQANIEDVRDRDYSTFTRLTDEEAAAIWSSPAAILPGARVSPGTERTALYTELGQAVSGGWKFVLATALAVETDTEEVEEPDAQQEGEEEEPDPDTGFRRFVSGGGNLSFAAARPLALRSVGYSDQVIVAVPRVWANVPALSDANAVEDFGGELAAEYSYLRYSRERPVSHADVEDDGFGPPAEDEGEGGGDGELPFLAFQLRAGLVMGTNSFYRTIGHDGEEMFVYTVPSLNLQFDNGVKLGVSWFYAFGDFSDHENLSFHITLAPSKSANP